MAVLCLELSKHGNILGKLLFARVPRKLNLVEEFVLVRLDHPQGCIWLFKLCIGIALPLPCGPLGQLHVFLLGNICVAILFEILLELQVHHLPIIMHLHLYQFELLQDWHHFLVQGLHFLLLVGQPFLRLLDHDPHFVCLLVDRRPFPQDVLAFIAHIVQRREFLSFQLHRGKVHDVGRYRKVVFSLYGGPLPLLLLLLLFG
mmetsp:Transcript_18523/g.31834  ORF Transcript_18523/g.31834 Transcript_18523/m.31834 type:complete len:202 (+) Transcript_18523:997-1602(+)